MDDGSFLGFTAYTNSRWTSEFFFFFNDTATTEIYTLSLHDALPICRAGSALHAGRGEPPGWVPTSVLPHLPRLAGSEFSVREARLCSRRGPAAHRL